jgi:TolB-like protein
LGLIRNIKERRLFQIVAAYAAGGFVVLEVADQLIQNEVIPEWIYPILLSSYLVGFGAAFVIGWFHGEKGAQKVPVSEVVILGVLGLILVGIAGLQVSRHLSEGEARAAAAASELDLRRIAVTYFEDAGLDGESQYLADAFTEELIQELASVRALDVVSRNAVTPYRQAGVPVDSIARALRAGTVVTGTVEQTGDLVRVNIRIHDGLSGTEFRRATLERPSDEILTARDAVINETASFLREWLGEEITVRRRQGDTEDRAAWALLQRAERERKEGERLLHDQGLEATFAAFDRADELLARAETVDASWTEPVVLRGEIAYRRSRLNYAPPAAAEPWIELGLEHAARALAMEPSHAGALALRGTLRAWRFLLPLIPDAAERQATLRGARADLEEAVRLDPTLASAHSVLSAVYSWEDQMSSSVLAARRAYEEDAYLEDIDLVLWRLVSGHYDMESFGDVRNWCQVGADRFPDHWRFAQCQLLVMTTSAGEPEVERAWELLARVDSLLPESERDLQYAVSQTYVGGILARASLPDSADAVLRRARDMFRPELDPYRDIFMHEAAMRASLLDDEEEAIELMKQFAAVQPGYDFSHHWWWRSVRSHPRYAELSAFQASH